MQHYHEALNNAGKNPKFTWNQDVLRKEVKKILRSDKEKKIL